jgi:hypothetical protein
MAQLHHLIGAILRDIAQGRVTSDLYSREVSRYYEQDSLLRLFPIPRTEIKEVEIDLKFAIAEIDIDPDRTEDRGAQFSGIFERYSDTFTAVVFEKMFATSKKNTAWQNFVIGFDIPENRLNLKTEIVNYFELNKDKLIEEEITNNQSGGTDTNLALKKVDTLNGLKETLEKVLYSQLDLSAVPKGGDALSAAKQSINKEIQAQIELLGNEIEYVEAAEYKAEVLVTADELQKISSEGISSIKIVTSMRNYVWSQVSDKDGQIIRRLIPE